jgi:hypothetical protein
VYSPRLGRPLHQPAPHLRPRHMRLPAGGRHPVDRPRRRLG